jgi:hypothetical protein
MAVSGRPARCRKVPGSRRDFLRVLGHPLVRVVHEGLEARAIEIGDPRREVAADDAIEEEMAEETHAQALASGACRAGREEGAQLRFEHAAHEVAEAILQGPIVSALVGEVEVDPARVRQRRFGARLAELARARMQRLETLVYSRRERSRCAWLS